MLRDDQLHKLRWRVYPVIDCPPVITILWIEGPGPIPQRLSDDEAATWAIVLVEMARDLSCPESWPWIRPLEASAVHEAYAKFLAAYT